MLIFHVVYAVVFLWETTPAGLIVISAGEYFSSLSLSLLRSLLQHSEGCVVMNFVGRIASFGLHTINETGSRKVGLNVNTRNI